MENEYYTPEIEEFYVGFEYEIKGSSGFGWLDLKDDKARQESIKINWDRTFKKCIWGIQEESPFGDNIGMLKYTIKYKFIK